MAEKHSIGQRLPAVNVEEDPRGDRRLLSSFRWAFAGIWYALRTQRNFRIHLLITAGVIAAGIWLELSVLEWVVIALTVALVLMAEMFNTVAETAIDMATSRFHPLAKIAKDVAAGAVLICAAISVIIGLLVLGPHLVQRLRPW
ncbi:MAG: diacylglycerol kinase family protein [Anaerolineae bacterium]